MRRVRFDTAAEVREAGELAAGGLAGEIAAGGLAAGEAALRAEEKIDGKPGAAPCVLGSGSGADDGAISETITTCAGALGA